MLQLKQRGLEMPEKDKVLRGSRDGFVETLIFNTALIRRRIRDTDFTIEITTAGESSHTDIAICYMKRRVDQELLVKIKERIENLQVDALSMNQESLAELLLPGHWFNPFPKYHLTEREMEILRQLGEGLTNQEIGRRLCISEVTVKKHMSHIFEKMQVKNRNQLLLKLH